MQMNCKTEKFEAPPSVEGLVPYYGEEINREPWLPPKGWMVMRAWSPKYLHYRSEAGTIYQFRLDHFHNWTGVLLTSTRHDTFWFFGRAFSIEHTMNRARHGQEKYSSKTSCSGYVCWGNYFEDHLKRLEEHMREENFRIESVKEIYKELIRRREE